MKIGIIHTCYINRGGEDVVVEQESAYLKERNCEITRLEFKNPTSAIGKVANVLMSPFNIGSLLKVNRWILEERPDVIHIHNWHFRSSPSVIWAARINNVPIVHTLHNFRLLCPSATLFNNNSLFFDSLNKKFPWRAISRKVYRNSFIQTFLTAFSVWLNKMVGTWNQVDRFIALSDYAKNVFLSANNGLNLKDDRIIVKSNFVSPIKYEQTETGNYFLFVGRLTEEKGVRVLLDAFAGTNHQLKIIGDGPLSELTENIAAANPNIQYLGFRNRDYIIEALKKSTALICPSVWLEGPLTVIESFACGTPVLASRIGAMESMITSGHNGFHFNSGDAEDLKIALDKWENVPDEEKTAFRINARNTYDQYYTPERNIDQLLTIYNNLLYEKNRPFEHPGKYGCL